MSRVYGPIWLSLAAIFFLGQLAQAQDHPDYWAVTGVAANDVLHLRDVPSAEAKSLAGVPPNARHLKNLGCRRNQPDLVQWMHLNQKARREALTEWCRVDYRGLQGWVAARFLKRDDAPPH